MINEIAHAKINLCLHVLGQRDDGNHLLDGVVVFTKFGDKLTLSEADKFNFEISGPFENGLERGQNLVLDAYRLMARQQDVATINLVKNLPVASGVGGGSADAAATLRGLSKLFDMDVPSKETLVILGADVPVCMSNHPQRMRGIGEIVTPIYGLPSFAMLLVNPNISISTAMIFNGLAKKNNPNLPTVPEDFQSYNSFVTWLNSTRNDLEKPAMAICPAISNVIFELENLGADVARMSGSGATCFGMFETLAAAKKAANKLSSKRPDWWMVATALA